MRTTRTILTRLMLAAVLATLAAYAAARNGAFEWPRMYDPLALPDLDAPTHWLTAMQLKLVDADAGNCVVALARTGVAKLLQPPQNEGSCSRTGTVKIARLSAASLRSEETRCAIAARLYMWERNVLQPAAQRLLGEPIKEILHFGSYSCRTMRGRSALSEHGSANAFDISGFRTVSGKVISVQRDWAKTSNEGKLLYVARDGLCDYFNVTLSPDYNSDHADHFHVDMGWYRTCR